MICYYPKSLITISGTIQITQHRTFSLSVRVMEKVNLFQQIPITFQRFKADLQSVVREMFRNTKTRTYSREIVSVHKQPKRRNIKDFLRSIITVFQEKYVVKTLMKFEDNNFTKMNLAF